MKTFSDRFIKTAQYILPTPMAIAVLLTVLTILLASLLTTRSYEAIAVRDNSTDSIVATLSLSQPQIQRFQIQGLRDSIYMGVEKGAIVLQIKGEEVLYRQPFQIKPKPKPLDDKIKLKKGHSLQIIQKHSAEPYVMRLLSYWEGGFFSFLTFAMQMMLILVLGHVLALTQPADWLIRGLVSHCNSTVKAAYIVTLATLLVAFFNWGLALIFGAILARKVGEHAAKNSFALNYPLIGAAGYSGLMVWHGGLSDSAPLKIAEQNHELAAQMGVISIGDTIFSTMNIICTIVLLLLIPIAMAILARISYRQNIIPTLQPIPTPSAKTDVEKPVGAERLDYAKWFAIALGSIMLLVGIYKTVVKPIFYDGLSFDWSFKFINPNYIIFMLFGLALVLHGSLRNFNKGVEEAIGGSAGIMIQFPLYAGIAGIMKYSGLIEILSNLIISLSDFIPFQILIFLNWKLNY